MIKVLKASAGSGKTYALAKQYIGLLLKSDDPYAYRHVLAVTFTNKATDEMKRRILKELNILSQDPSASDYHDDFVPSVFPDDKSLADKSLTVLSGILHDYGAFAVSTIDTFFQQTLRAFSREIGHFASYQIELDRKGLIEESVDRVLDSLTESEEDASTLGWIAQNTISRIEDGGYYSLESVLKELAVRLFSTARSSKCEEFGISDDKMFSPDAVKALSDSCDKVVDALSLKVKNASGRLSSALSEAGIDPSVTTRSFVAKILNKTKSGWDGFVPTDNELALLPCPDSWFKKTDKLSAKKLTPAVYNGAEELAGCFDMEARKLFNTAKILKSQIYGFGVAAELSRSFKELLADKNVLSLDDSNTILRDIIDGTDAPFIYEKMGVRFENFLLDEFQDTSRIQWGNFLPLLRDSVANGAENLIVGDVKQSIYRWRDSDWKLLGEEVPREFQGYMETDKLDTNWRSRKNIVEFNNDFFKFASGELDKLYGGGCEDISTMYSDVRQEVSPRKSEGGFVNIELCPEEEDEPAKVAQVINEARDKGFRLSDIAVLVRGHDDGALLSNYLIENDIPVLTDDSLLVRGAVTVRRLEALLGGIDNPSDSFAAFLSRQLDVEIPKEYRSLMELCDILLESLRKKYPQTYKAETLYVQSYMDKLRDFQKNEGGELHSFLEKMKGDKSYISSPSSGDFVRMITVHKSKGLDFPLVIVPFVESIGLFRPEKLWCKPELEGTSLSDIPEGVYDVTLSGKSEATYFDKDYRREMLLQYIDNLNIAYVAFTRASQAMYIIGSEPKESMTDFSGILRSYLGSKKVEGNTYILGELKYYAGKAETEAVTRLDCEYVSVPLGDRLGTSRDCSDFFDDEGVPGESARLKGVVLHSIMEGVTVPSDLDSSIDDAVFSGTLASESANMVKEVLAARIASAAKRGWFPDDASQVWDEVDIIAADGSLHRPDRVLRRPDGSVLIIDYKFGAQRRSYEDQVRQYAMLYKSMGYENVEAVLWYVWEDIEKKVSL